jgi:hypothetical protein
MGNLDAHHGFGGWSDRVVFGNTCRLRLLTCTFFAKRYGNPDIAMRTTVSPIRCATRPLPSIRPAETSLTRGTP